MPTIRALLDEARRTLAAASDSAALDAEILLAEALETDRAHLRAWPEREPAAALVTRFLELLARRAAGEPVAHILGRREFWSLDLAVTPATLIPRPETEHLVEAALELAPAGPLDLLELGTGSGAIALALAHERPAWRITATDRSTEALTVARKNAEKFGFAQVEFLSGDWFEPVTGRCFDLIVANPPYVAAGDPHLAEGDVRFEPRSALAAGADGLDDIRHIAAAAPTHLRAGGHLLLEHGYDQGAAVARLLDEAGFIEVRTRADLAGRPRLTSGHLPPSA